MKGTFRCLLLTTDTFLKCFLHHFVVKCLGPRALNHIFIQMFIYTVGAIRIWEEIMRKQLHIFF